VNLVSETEWQPCFTCAIMMSFVLCHVFVGNVNCTAHSERQTTIMMSTLSSN